MAFFRNNVLDRYIPPTKSKELGHQFIGSISKSDTPKTALERLGKPMPLCIQKWDQLVYVIATEMNLASTQGNKIFNATSTAETKQLKRSLA